MTVIRRDVVSVPRRTPAETWVAICQLVSRDGSRSRAELEAAGDVATILIAQEATKHSPAIFSGVGPQVRVYTLHDDDSIEADLDGEQPLVNVVTDADWTASLPADDSDLTWATAALDRAATRVTVRKAET